MLQKHYRKVNPTILKIIIANHEGIALGEEAVSRIGDIITAAFSNMPPTNFKVDIDLLKAILENNKDIEVDEPRLKMLMDVINVSFPGVGGKPPTSPVMLALAPAPPAPAPAPSSPLDRPSPAVLPIPKRIRIVFDDHSSEAEEGEEEEEEEEDEIEDYEEEIRSPMLRPPLQMNLSSYKTIHRQPYHKIINSEFYRQVLGPILDGTINGWESQTVNGVCEFQSKLKALLKDGLTRFESGGISHLDRTCVCCGKGRIVREYIKVIKSDDTEELWLFNIHCLDRFVRLLKIYDHLRHLSKDALRIRLVSSGKEYKYRGNLEQAFRRLELLLKKSRETEEMVKKMHN